MIEHAMRQTDDYPGLPDPDRQPDFYQDVPTKRLVAWIVDTILIGLIVMITIPLTLGLVMLFVPLIFFLYRVVFIARNSATPGMSLVALEFRDHRGRRFDTLMAVMHTAGFALSSAMVFPQIVSIAMMLMSVRKQGLTDVVLGTAAINRSR